MYSFIHLAKLLVGRNYANLLHLSHSAKIFVRILVFDCALRMFMRKMLEKVVDRLSAQCVIEMNNSPKTFHYPAIKLDLWRRICVDSEIQLCAHRPHNCATVGTQQFRAFRTDLYCQNDIFYLSHCSALISSSCLARIRRIRQFRAHRHEQDHIARRAGRCPDQSSLILPTLA